MPSSSTIPSIDSVTPEYASQWSTYWELIADLMGGTRAMREAGERWLPREDGESVTAYSARIARSFLFNGFEDTCRGIAGKPFARPMQIFPASLQQKLRPLLRHVDDNGRSLERVGRQGLRIGLAYGVVHALITFPDTSATGATRTRRDEQESGVRPQVSIVHPLSLIGWVISRDEHGRERLEAVKIREKATDPDTDAYTTTLVDQIRVITRTEQILYQSRVIRGERAEYAEVSRVAHTFGEVPLVTAMYGEPFNLVLAEPPYLNLAYANIEHWQSSSDQRNILRFARAGTYFAAGFTAEEIERGIPVGGNGIVSTTNENGRLEVVEWAGHAIEAGCNDIAAIEKRMTVLAMRPLIDRPGRETATARVIDESKSQTQVEDWICETEQWLENIIQYMLRWQSQESILPEDFRVVLDRDFALNITATEDTRILLDSATNNKLSTVTYLEELRRRSLLSDAVNIEQEVERIAEQEAERLRVTTELMQIGQQGANDKTEENPPNLKQPPENLGGGE